MRYVVTGGSGYLGKRLAARLADRDDVERVAAADITPRELPAKVDFQNLDVRNPDACQMVLSHERPDVLVHMAAVVEPSSDPNATRDVNVGGTNNVLAAAAGTGIRHIVIVSAAAGYGPAEEAAAPLTEAAAMRGNADFDYARDAANADRMAQLWTARFGDRITTIVRPCIVLGPGVDNSIVRLWTEKPFAGRLAPPDQPIQFLHEDDMTDALLALIDGGHGGVFNIAGEGQMTLGECAELAGLKRPKLLKLGKDPSLGFLVNSPLLDTGRIHGAGWSPRHTSREAFEAALRAHGRLSSARAA